MQITQHQEQQEQFIITLIKMENTYIGIFLVTFILVLIFSKNKANSSFSDKILPTFIKSIIIVFVIILFLEYSMNKAADGVAKNLQDSMIRK